MSNGINFINFVKLSQNLNILEFQLFKSKQLIIVLSKQPV